MSLRKKAAREEPTRAQVRRNEKKNERGVCRIQKRCPAGNLSGRSGGQQVYETVGCGSLVKHVPEWSQTKYAIITSNKVFQEDFNAQKYRVEFKKSDSKVKTFEMNLAFSGPILQDLASGLTVIPLNSHSSIFRHGFFKKKCNVLKHSHFKVKLLNEFSNGVCCHMVADDTSSNRSGSFGVKPHELTRDPSGQYYLSNVSWPRFPLGAAILRKANEEWSLVGVLNSDSGNPERFQPVFLSSKEFKNLRSGKLIN